MKKKEKKVGMRVTLKDFILESQRSFGETRK